METGLSSCVVMTDVVAHVESVLLVKAAVPELVPVFPIVMADNAVMTVVVINPVANAPPLKPVKMDNVLELQLLIAQEKFVDPTEQEEVVVLVLPVKDAVLGNASATMIVMKETVVMLFNQTEAILQLVPHDHVELAPMDSLVDPTDDVQLRPHVQSMLLLSTALQKRPLEPLHQL